MRNQKFTALLFLMIGLASGCGQTAPIDSSQSDRHDPSAVPMPSPSAEQIKAAKDGRLTCNFSGECQPALAMVSVATGEGVSRCSGFLISDHEVLTNDHCFESIPDQPTACAGIVFAHFTDGVDRECKRITIRSHQTGIDTKDYAVMELTSAVKDRHPLDLAKRGFNNHETATVYSVQADHNSALNSFDGEQVKLNCHASYSTLMDINILSSKESLMTFGDCAIHEGDSGSPILNQDGDVGAIAQGFLTIKDDHFSDLLKPYLLDGSYGEVTIATQAFCIPELSGAIAKSCNPVKTMSALYPDDYLKGFGQFSAQVLPTLSFGVYWKELPSLNPRQLKFISVPTCITPSEVRTGVLSFTSSVMIYSQGINSRLEAEWRNNSEEQTLFSMQKPSSAASPTVTFTSNAYGTIALPVCTH